MKNYVVILHARCRQSTNTGSFAYRISYEGKSSLISKCISTEGLTSVRTFLYAIIDVLLQTPEGVNISIITNLESFILPFKSGQARIRLANGAQDNGDLWSRIYELVDHKTVVNADYISSSDPNFLPIVKESEAVLRIGNPENVEETSLNYIRHHMGHTTIAIANFKGGVAKTTSTINLAGIFQRKGYKVLVIDHDPQGNLTSGFGIGINENIRTLHEAIIDMNSLPIYSVRENLDIVPSDIRLSSIEKELRGTKGRVKRLAELLSQVKENYDIILIDCPPNHGVGSNSALVAADYVLIPMEATLFSIKGLKEMFETIEVAKGINKTIKILGIFITRFRKTKDKLNVLTELHERYPDIVLQAIIRDTTSVSAGQLARTDILTYDPRSKGAEDYINLANEIIDKLSNNGTDSDN